MVGGLKSVPTASKHVLHMITRSSTNKKVKYVYVAGIISESIQSYIHVLLSNLP